MKTALQGIGGLLLAALLLYLVFRNIDRQDLRNALATVSWPALAAGAAINIGHNVFRVYRWRALLEPVRRAVALRPLFVSVILGYMTTWILPGRVGELVRPALLSARENLPLGPTLGTVVADRLLDGVAIVVLFAVGSMTARFAAGSAALAGQIRVTAAVSAAAVLAGLAMLVATSSSGEKLERWLRGRSAPLRWIGRVAVGLSRGADALRSPRLLAKILAHSLLAWTTIALGTWIGIRAVGADVSFADVLVMLPLLALGVSIPTPGGVGGYHAAMQIGLTRLFGVDPTTAASAGLLMHVAIVAPILIAGPVLLYTERLSLADLVAAGKQVRALGSEASFTGATG
jgi:uncharacterized protein (TIRG00374 family)